MKSFLLDLFFPKYCVSCRVEGEYLCEKCSKCLCPRLESEKLGDIDELLSLFRYSETPAVKELIKLMKYKFCREIVEIFDFGQLKSLENCIVVPVPLHRKRLAYRGFNQAEVLGEYVANLHKLKLGNLLKRVRHTDQQARLRRSSRLENMKGAFELCEQLDSCSIFLLVDDVATTGATLNECAKTLRKAGAKKVLAFVLARG